MWMVGDEVKDLVFRQSTINPCLSMRAEIWNRLVNTGIIRYWVGALVDRWHWYYEMSNWQLASESLIDGDADNTATGDPLRLDYISPFKLKYLVSSYVIIGIWLQC
jgi:hypothetical protein